MRERHTMPAGERLVTAEEFARIPDDDFHYELVEGRVVRMSPPGIRHGLVSTRISFLLSQHIDVHPLGVVITPGGFKLATDPDTVREPDVAFVRRDRIPDEGVPDGFWTGAPDLAVEIRSPGDRQSEILAKVHDYLARGVRLVWVVDPKKRTVSVHRPHSAPEALGVDDVLDGNDVVAGFSCKISRIFEV